MDAHRPDPVPSAKSILLVEDHAAVRSFALRVLTSCGYTVLVASDGAEALQLASVPIDLLVTDVVLPDVSGRVLAERFVPGVCVLYISGQTRDVFGVAPKQFHFLQKPFSPAALLVGFYTLRHTFRTIADAAKDQPADFIMGHESPHMSTAYRESIADERLRAVTDDVREWLFSAATDADKTDEEEWMRLCRVKAIITRHAGPVCRSGLTSRAS